MSVGTRASQASPLGDAVLRTARASRRAANKVALAALATAPPRLSRRTLRLSRLQRSAARVSESCAALQIRLRGRRFQCCAGILDCALPFGRMLFTPTLLLTGVRQLAT